MNRKNLEKVLAALVLVAALAVVFYIAVYDGGGGSAETPAVISGEAPPAEDGPAGVRLVTWNLYNFGGSKNEEEVAFMADWLREADLVAVQEVNTGPDGAQAVARLAQALGRRGAQWDYAVSDPTTGDGSERYAYLWKPSRVRLLGRPWLEERLAAPVDREPYLARFETRRGGRRLLVASFHAVPTAKRPAEEIALLDALDRAYDPDDLVILGDFNLAESDAAFDALKALGFAPVLEGQKTSLRRRRTEDRGHLASEYDNIFYETEALHAAGAGALDFTEGFATLKDARQISDHLPLFMDVRWTATETAPASAR